MARLSGLDTVEELSGADVEHRVGCQRRAGNAGAARGAWRPRWPWWPLQSECARRCLPLRGYQPDTHGGHPEDAEPCDPAFVSRRGCGECAHDDGVSEDSAHDEQTQPCSLDMTPLDAECAEGDEQ